MRSQSHTALSMMLTLSAFAAAAMINIPRDSNTDTMQLTCATGMPAMMCNSLWGTYCSSGGTIIQPAPADIADAGDCSSAHCTCALAPPVPCVTGKGTAVVCGITNGPNAPMELTSFPGSQTTQVVSSTDAVVPNTIVAATSSSNVLTDTSVPSITAAATSSSSGSDTWQLNCTTGLPGFFCTSLWGTNCSSNGTMMQPAPDSWNNGACSSKSCICALAPQMPCVTETGGGVVCGPMAITISKNETVALPSPIVTTPTPNLSAATTISSASASSSTDTWQLNCTTGMPAIECSGLWGTACSSNGTMMQVAPAKWQNGDCSPGHCVCALAPPIPCVTEIGGGVVCGPFATTIPKSETLPFANSTMTAASPNVDAAAETSYGSSSTLQPGSCATVTVTVTHFQDRNATHAGHRSGLDKTTEHCHHHHHQNETFCSGYRPHSMTTLGSQQPGAAATSTTSTPGGY